MFIFDQQRFASEVTRWRKREGQSMEVAAQDTGLSAATFSRLESLKALPDVNTLLILCTWMNKHPKTYFKPAH